MTSLEEPIKILIAEDDDVSRRILEFLLKKWNYDVISTENGAQAWDYLKKDDAPRLVILDWMMPEMDGPDVCRRVREKWEKEYVYIIMLTAKDTKQDIVEALNAGADDFLNKPYNQDELQCRIKVGLRVIGLEQALSNKIADLEYALAHVKTLQGLLPICSYCKKVRDDKNYWHQVEEYVTVNSEAKFSHGICPECFDKYAKAELEELKQQKATQAQELKQ
jgi:CheY-like chemotaxis protein